MSSFDIQRPKVRIFYPKWSLKIVLDYLSSDVFEPLETLSLPKLTYKTVFLVTLATAARVSEVQAFSIQQGCFRENLDGSVTLLTFPGFLPKNVKPSAGGHEVTIHPLPENEVICPVRLLKRYLCFIKPMRGRTDSAQLFVNHQQLGKRVSAVNISHWVAQTVKCAYSWKASRVVSSQASGSMARTEPVGGLRRTFAVNRESGPTTTGTGGECITSPPRLDTEDISRAAHELRAIAASLALRTGTSLTDVIRAVGWTSETTFGRFYLRHYGITDGSNEAAVSASLPQI